MTFSDDLSNIVCVDFLCLDFGVQMVREIPRSMSQQWVSIQYKQCIPKLESTYISNHCTVTGTSLLRCYQDCHGTAEACLSKLLAPAARSLVAQTWSDWIWHSACAYAAARQTCGSDRAAKVQRPAPAQVNAKQPWQRRDRMYMHEFAPKLLTEIHAYTCIYVHTVSQQGVSICKYLMEIWTHTAPVKSIYCFNEVRYLHIHAFTCTYVHCTYIYVHVRMHTVCTVCCTYMQVLLRTYLHINHTLYAIIRANIHAYTVCQDHWWR